jgi:pimeloyl-ACP methyl ester carboxylesterase
MIPTPDGEELHAFHIRPANLQYARNITVLMFHGNAGNIGYRLPIAKILASEVGCNVLMLQYRGYGRSTGNPDEKGLKIDAQTALDFLRSNDELKGRRIIVYGQSLGGAVGINLVAENQEQGDIAGLILENTFTSIRKLIPRYVQIFIIIVRICSSDKNMQCVPTCTFPCALVPSTLDQRGDHSPDKSCAHPLPQWTSR